MPIRARTFFPRHIGGLTFRYPHGGRCRFVSRYHTCGEGKGPINPLSYWPAAPAGPRRDILWWRYKLSHRRDVDRMTTRYLRDLAKEMKRACPPLHRRGDCRPPEPRRRL